MIERANVLVLGGGVVGTSIAWALAQRGVDDVVVVDLDLAGLYASSELNAGGARASWWQPVNIESCRETLAFFDTHRERLGFRRSGYLWLYDDEMLWQRALEKRVLQNDYGLGVERLDAHEVAARFPLLDRHLEEIVGATFSPGDGLVNPNAVRMLYREEAQALGVRFENRHYASGVSTSLSSGPGGSQRRVVSVDVMEVAAGGVLEADEVVREILTTHHVPPRARLREQRIECGALVNALGAWSPVFSAKIGVADVSEPVRRQISLVDVHPEDLARGVSFESQGMVVDASGLYLHPEGSHWLVGYSLEEEPPGFDFAYDGSEFFEEEIWPRLAHRASSFERCGHVRGWAGLYAVTPDRSGIAGAVGGFSNLYEAHSFTGRGVMQSYAVGRSLAARIVTGEWEGVDLAPLARDRFTERDRWVLEELHI